MSPQVIEKGDIVALKTGGEVEILSVKMDGDELRRFDYVDRRDASPMRKTAYPSEILRLLRKGVIRNPNPLAERPYDNTVTHKPSPIETNHSPAPIKPKTGKGK